MSNVSQDTAGHSALGVVSTWRGPGPTHALVTDPNGPPHRLISHVRVHVIFAHGTVSALGSGARLCATWKTTLSHRQWGGCPAFSWERSASRSCCICVSFYCQTVRVHAWALRHSQTAKLGIKVQLSELTASTCVLLLCHPFIFGSVVLGLAGVPSWLPSQSSEIKWSFHAAELSFCPCKQRTLISTASSCSHKMLLLPEQTAAGEWSAAFIADHGYGC